MLCCDKTAIVINKILAELQHAKHASKAALGRDGRGERACLSLERLWWPLRAEKMREGLNYDN